MDTRKNPVNNLDRERLKPVRVETCGCDERERDAAQSQNEEGCVLET